MPWTGPEWYLSSPLFRARFVVFFFVERRKKRATGGRNPAGTTGTTRALTVYIQHTHISAHLGRTINIQHTSLDPFPILLNVPLKNTFLHTAAPLTPPHATRP